MVYFGAELQISKNVQKTKRIIAKPVSLNSRNTFWKQKKAPETPKTPKMGTFWKYGKIIIFQLFEEVQ